MVSIYVERVGGRPRALHPLSSTVHVSVDDEPWGIHPLVQERPPEVEVGDAPYGIHPPLHSGFNFFWAGVRG